MLIAAIATVPLAPRFCSPGTAVYPSGPGFALVNSTGTNPTAPVSVVGR